MTQIGVHALEATQAFAARLRQEGQARYHDQHPFHLLMHEGKLTRTEIQQWVLNRYYYQTRLPIKDALILAKAEDVAFRRAWVTRLLQQDGFGGDPGGLARWLALAEGVGLDPSEVQRCRRVLPGVRDACDRYVDLVRGWTLLEAVASSLTELFAPHLMARRIEAWERHYPWIGPGTLDYFRSRVQQARADADHGFAFVLRHATTPELQARCLAALTEKTTILRDMLDAIHAACVR